MRITASDLRVRAVLADICIVTTAITVGTPSEAPADTPSENSNWQVLNVVSGIILVGLVWRMSLPGSSGFSILLTFGGLIAFSVWALFVIRLHRTPARMSQVAVVPLLVVAVLALSMWSLPLQARFAISESSFDAFVEEHAEELGLGPDRAAPAGTRIAQRVVPDGRIGSYEISSVNWEGDVLLFWSESGGRSGFAYVPNGSDRLDVPDLSLKPISRDWYEFTATF